MGSAAIFTCLQYCPLVSEHLMWGKDTALRWEKSGIMSEQVSCVGEYAIVKKGMKRKTRAIDGNKIVQQQQNNPPHITAISITRKKRTYLFS